MVFSLRACSVTQNFGIPKGFWQELLVILGNSCQNFWEFSEFLVTKQALIVYYTTFTTRLVSLIVKCSTHLSSTRFLSLLTSDHPQADLCFCSFVYTDGSLVLVCAVTTLFVALAHRLLCPYIPLSSSEYYWRLCYPSIGSVPRTTLVIAPCRLLYVIIHKNIITFKRNINTDHTYLSESIALAH